MASKRKFLLFPIVALFCQGSDSTIWLRNIRFQGQTAAVAGASCLATLSKSYFHDPDISRAKNIVITYTYNMTSPASTIQQRYLTWLHQSIANGDVDQILLQLISTHRSVAEIETIASNAIYETDYYVIVTDQYKKLHRLLWTAISRSASFNPGAKFIIMYNNPIDAMHIAHRDHFAHNIFRLLYNRFNAANVVFMFAHGVDSYTVYVTNPYRSPYECGSLKPLVLDVCTNGKLGKQEATTDWLLASKVPATLPNCTFKFCARVTEPYINEGCQSGLEVEIIHTMQNILKFKIDTFCTEMDRGEPFGNGSWSGILGMLRDDMCDFVVGGFFPDYDVHDDFGVTNSYFQDAYTWYVFIAPLQPRWLGLIRIFGPYTWSAFVCISMLSAFTWFLLGRSLPERAPHKRLTLCFLNSWAVFLGISANNRPNWLPLRLFFVFLAIYALNMTTIYTSKLITVFTNPAYEDQVDTIDEIIESGMAIGGRDEYHDWFDNENEEDKIFYRLYNSSSAFWPTLDNLDAIRRGERVVLLNRIFVLSKSTEAIFGLPQNVFTNPLEMISERGFPLLKPFSTLISHMIDAGIIDKLYDDFFYNETILENIRNRTRIPDSGQIVLTLEHLNGAFTVWFLGLFLSTLTFLCECLVHWYHERGRNLLLKPESNNKKRNGKSA